MITLFQKKIALLSDDLGDSTIDLSIGTLKPPRTLCLSNKGSSLQMVSSVIIILVLLMAAVVRIGVNCARLFGMSTTFSLE